MKFIENVRGAYGADVTADRGDIVQTILLIAGFAIVTVLAVNWLGGAILAKGVDTANCIDGVNTTTSGGTKTACNNKNSENNSKIEKEYNGTTYTK